MSDTVEIHTAEIAVSEMNTWLTGFMQPSESDSKLMLCGPRFYGIVTGCYDPRYWPRLRGNSRQRRIKRRHLQSMWDATKDSVAALHQRWADEGHPISGPSRTLSTW